MHKLLVKLPAALLILWALPALGQSIVISCDGSPDQATLEVPAPANKFLAITCTRYGHVLHPQDGWLWTPPGAYRPIHYPAQMVRADPRETNNEVYFDSVEVVELTGEEIATSWKAIGDMFDPNQALPLQAMRIVARSSDGDAHTIYFFESGWGWSCSPNCDKKTVFLAVSEPKQDVSW